MAFAGKKVIQLITTLLLVSVMTFLAFQIIPGDPARLIAGINATEEQVEALRVRMGLNHPPLERFGRWFAGLVTGNPGDSLRYNRPITSLIGERLPVTLALAVIGLVITLLLGLSLGLAAARWQDRWPDRLIQACCQLNLAIPPFFMGILLILLFSFVLRWMGVRSYSDYRAGLLPFLRSLLVPGLALGLPRSAMVAGFLRSALVSQTRLDYVRTARSKGASDTRVLYRHMFGNALVPVLSTMGIVAAELLGGSLIVEQVFALPGMGSLLILAIGARDFPLIQTMVVYMAAVVVGVNLIIDLLYRVADPRIRL